MTPCTHTARGDAGFGRLRAAARLMLALGLLGALSGCSLLRGGLDVANPRTQWPIAPDAPMPRVMRYVSSLAGHEGAPCYGLVLADEEGIPTEVLNLTAIDPRLGSGLDTFVANGGFALAERLTANPAELEGQGAYRETLDPRRLGEVVLPVVEITMEDLEAGRRVNIGVGLNYGEHKEESGAEKIDKTLFPKFVGTTGAYAPVSLGVQVDEPSKPVLLGDYEVEIGYVVLRDIDLANPPADPAAFYESVAFFTANDVSDREPIIRDRKCGFTQGKSHPTYSPVGPWMVHGRHLQPKAPGEGRDEMTLNLLVEEADPAEGGTWRQGDRSTSMIRGPFATLGMIAEIWKDCAMVDAGGTCRRLVVVRDGRVMIPAGSIVLTGTPGGTAIRAPGGADLFRLLLLGRFSISGALDAYVQHCETHREAMGFLSPGDVMDARVQHLGRQRTPVVE